MHANHGRRNLSASACLAAGVLLGAGLAPGVPYLDNQTIYSNQDPNTETRRSDHIRINFGHYNRDTGTPMTEQLAQGNLQMYEQMWNRWVNELGLHDINESVTNPDGNKYRANFNVLMTWNDGGGGGAYSSMDGGGFFYAMANTGYCRYDPPSGATPHEFGHVWEGSCAGFNGSNSSGAWWECTANWMQLQFLNSYPQAGAYIANGMYYPAHGRDYYDSWVIWEAARDDSRYGAAWVNSVWTNATADQRTNEYIIDRMIRLDSSGSADKAGAVNDLWGDMARKMITWDFERQRWLATANSADDGSDWNFYQRCRTPLVKVPGASGWYRPSRGHIPMEFGFNFIPLTVSAGTTVSCTFAPQCDPVRQSDWRACLVAVNSAGGASYSSLWNSGTNSITLSADQSKLYLAVIATPKPMKIADPAWQAYLTDAGLQFPYAVSFTNATPKNVIYPVQSHTGMVQHANGGGWKATTATVDATAWLGPNAQVLNTAQVKGNARIEDYAVVKNSAQVRDNAVVSGHALVEANAQVYGNAKVRDWGHVFGYAEIYENGRVLEHGNCGDGNATTHTKVYGNAIVKGTTYVYDTSTFAGCLIMDGDSANGNGTTASDHGVHFGWGWGQDVARFAALPDNGYLFARHSFEKDNAVFAMDEYGIDHGFLINGCRTAKDSGTSVRGGRVLPLDGVSQYVELHNGVNDVKDSTFAMWFKQSGGASDQRLWSFGDGSNKVMYLTPNAAATGALRFVITDGTTTQTLDGPAIAADTWKHVAVVFSGTTCTLYLDGAAVASNAAMTLFPDSLNAPLMENANYLGRGNAGNWFQGSVDDFRCYMRGFTAAEVLAVFNEAAPSPITLTADTTAPTPNAATWLVAPMANGDSSATMSATPGTDASGWVEYYFTCISGGGHDSGWVSFNKYTDVGLTPGSAPSYTVKMRDRNGNTTAASSAAAVTLATSSAGTAGFSYGPIGIADGQITMTATTVSSPSGKVEYKFDRTAPTTASSGWQSSPTWTNTGLTTGTSYTYTVTVRDGRGNTSGASAPVSALARDDAGPALPMTVAHWQMLPYATIDNKVSMTAQAASDPSGVEYYFHCVSGGGPDSAWQSGTTFVTPSALADGTYVYQYKVRDKSARNNESAYSASYPATITPTTGYHTYTLDQVLTGADDNLVSFPATVMKVNSDNYQVKDLASGSSITVRSAAYAQATDTSLALKNVTVKGHLYTFSGTRVVTFATLTSTGTPTLYNISGKVINSTGSAVAGATVAFSDVANASANPIVTTTTDASGNYSLGVTSGTWYVAATSSSYNTSADQSVIVNTSAVSGINFTLVANATVSGLVSSRVDGSPIAGATVYFSRSPGASAAPVFTVTTDASGNYAQAVQDGVWYVAASATGFFGSDDKTITVNGTSLGGIGFALRASTRIIPATPTPYFSAITESLPADGSNTGSWTQYLPSDGTTFPTIGNPTVKMLSGVKWVRNYRADSSRGDTGFQVRDLSANPVIACNGVSIVAAVRPIYVNPGGEPRGEIVDIFYDRLALAISHADGRIMVCRNRWNDWGPAIANNTSVILSLIVQPNGSYVVYSNGVQVMSGAANGDFSTQMVPTGTEGFKKYVNIGRNSPDGWSAFNGYIGDVFVYTSALSATDRQTLEADLTAKFLSTDYTITASAGTGGLVNPTGTVSINPGGSQTFTISPLAGYMIGNVTVDGVSQGATGSYAFSNVVANHTIAATFLPGLVSASQSTVSAAPSTVAADGTSTATITVTLKDAAGSPVAGKLVTLASNRGTSDTISAASGPSDASGVVTFTVRSGTLGAAVFTATDASEGNLPITQTATVTFLAGPVSVAQSTVVASPANIPPDGTTTSTITVTLLDAYGNPVSGKTVALASSRGATDTISAASGPSSASGVVTFTIKSSTLGAAVLTATDVTDGNLAITQTATVTFANSRYAVATGNWGSTSTWSLTSGGASGAPVPTSSDDVYIEGNRTVTLNVTSAAARSLSIASGSTLTMGSGTTARTLTVGGNVTNNGTIAPFSASSPVHTLNVAGNFTNTGTFTYANGNASIAVGMNGTIAQAIGGTSATVFGTLTISNTSAAVTASNNFSIATGKTMTVNASATFNTGAYVVSGAGTFALTAGGTLGCGSATGIASSGATGCIQTTTRTLPAGGNYTYNGTGAQTTGTGLPNNLTGIVTINSGGVVTLDNARTIASGGTLRLTAGTLAAGANLTMASTSSITRSGGAMTGTPQGAGTYNVTYTGTSMVSGPELSGAGLNNVTLGLTSGQTLTLGGNITVPGTLTTGTGNILDVGESNYQLTLSGTWSNSGTFSARNGTVVYNGAAQNIAALTYNNLTLSGSGAKTLAAGTVVNGNLSIAPTGSASASVGNGLSLSVNSLSLGGLGRVNGTWGAVNASCPATNKNSTYFGTGTTGVLNVVTDTRSTPVVATWPTATAIPYGSPLSASALSGGVPPVPGTFGFTTPGVKPGPVGSYQVSGTFTPSDSATYLPVVGANAIGVSVSRAALAITAAAQAKTYGQALAFGSGSLLFASSGLQNGETIGSVTLACGGAAANAAVAGSPYPIIPSAATGGTFNAANYDITYNNGALTVNPLALTFGGSRDYDGTSTAAADILAVSNLVSGDVVTLTGSAGLASRHMGTRAITSFGGLGVVGAQGTNYTLTGASGSVTISALPVTVTAVNATKTYDGNTSATGTPTVNPQLAPGDTTDVLSQAYLTSTAGEGNKVIVPSITINDGNGGADYQVTLQNFPSGTIHKAVATITLDNLAQAYDGTPKSVTATSTPAGLAIDLTYNGSATPPSAPGSYAVEAVINDPNHTGTATGTLVISGDPLAAWQASHFTPAEIAAGLAADDADPDGDGSTNLAEFAFNGDPRNGASNGLFVNRLADGKLAFTCAVRRGATFAASTGDEQVSLPVDGLVYTIEAAVALTGPWTSVVMHQDVADTAPAGSGLPDLTGTGWQYHTFTAFNGLPGTGFLRAVVAKP